jgi:hypothetical protein
MSKLINNYLYLWLKKLLLFGCSWGLIFSVPLLTICFSNHAYAAETVIFKYGFLRQSISISELSTFVETGEMSSSLRNFFELANQNPESIREVLGQEIEVDGVVLSKFLNSFPGGILLNILSEYIQTPSGRASKESLRGALVSSALPDNNIRLIEVLENYPTSEIHVEGDRLGEFFQGLKDIIDKIPVIDINLFR